MSIIEIGLLASLLAGLMTGVGALLGGGQPA